MNGSPATDGRSKQEERRYPHGATPENEVDGIGPFKNRELADGYALTTVLDSITRTAEYGVNIAEAGLQATLRDPGFEAASRPDDQQ